MSNFKEMGLQPEVLQALLDLGFEAPTPIQEQTIPHLLQSEQDLIALAQTGTGKTAAFSLPIIEKIEKGSRQVQAIILCPTRELCIQITSDIEKFIKYIKDIDVVAIYGGDSFERQIRALKKGSQIVVGTPGRVNDMIKKGILKLEQIRALVLDEADEMLNMGFKEELDEILASTPATKQTMLFSATMPRSIESIAGKYMKDAHRISTGKHNTGAENVKHEYYVVHARDKYEALRRILDATPDIYGIVFCRTRHETGDITDKLMQDHYSAEAIHGDISQAQRTEVMNRFRKKQTQVLVATDVAARGIDVSDLTHIINYSLADSPETYIHRSGRTGRAQKSGTSICITNMKEIYRIKEIERRSGKVFERKQIPSGKEICEKQLFNLIDKIKTAKVNETQIEQYLPTIYENLNSLKPEDLIKQVVSIEFNRFLSLYKDAVDLNVKAGGTNQYSNSSGNFTSLNINLGKNDNFSVPDLLGAFQQHPNLKNVQIGKIRLFNFFSVFEVEPAIAQEVIETLSQLNFKGKEVRVKLDNGPSHGGGGGRSFGGGGRSFGGGGGGGRGFGGRSSGGGGRGYAGGSSRRDGDRRESSRPYSDRRRSN